ncbi:MAG: tetratricopeptide repeat protein [Myxococcota bacterium]
MEPVPRELRDPAARGTSRAAVDELDVELIEIKREIIESRGLGIKTNNLVNALSADLKSIGRRQQTFERKAFWNSAAANVLFVVVVIAVVKFAWDARVEAVTRETRQSKATIERLEGELQAARARVEHRDQGETAAAAFYELIRAGKERELIDGWDALQGRDLTRAERRFFQDAVNEARSKLSVASYHQGLDHVRSGRWHEAVKNLEDAIRFSSNAAHAPSSKLNLARSYRRLNRQRDAIPILVKLAEASSNADVLDDAMFLLAECLIDIQAWNDAKTTLRTFIRRYPKSAYINDARMTLADLSLKH